MEHDTPLISIIAVGLGLAFLMGLLAQRFRIPVIVGYVVAGIIVGPFTPGYVADQSLATELAEIGVILLMFGVGLHFSLKDLASVRAIAVPGALGQIAAATLLGMGLGWALGWDASAGFLFGLALSVASTVVLLRALQESRLVETERGKIAVGWLIVEDLVMVLALVLIPAVFAGEGGGSSFILRELMLTAGKVGLFVAVMLLGGRKIIPWVLHYVAHTGSRELFRLAALAIALGVAFGSAKLFGVSFALGAFFAGMMLAESQLSTQAAKETLPLRDAFAVLFFVSVGMLFNPSVLVEMPLAVLATLLIIIIGKSCAAWLIVRAFGYRNSVALTVSASLAQIGEFSFILAVLGVKLEILPDLGRDLIVAGAILSIMLNPLIFSGVLAFLQRGRVSPDAAPETVQGPQPKPMPHVLIVGHGLIGQQVSAALLAAGDRRLTVVDEDETALAPLAGTRASALNGTVGEEDIRARIDFATVDLVICSIPDAYEAAYIAETARTHNPSIRIVAIANKPEEQDYVLKAGVSVAISGESEIVRRLVEEAGLIRVKAG